MAVLSMALSGTAQADPNLTNTGATDTAGFLPDADDFVGTGSDTSQYVINTAAKAYVPPAGSTQRLASFNACKPGTESAPVCNDQIQIRPTLSITRPNGSSAGVNALYANATLNYARSSRQSAVGPAEDDLFFIPALTDGLSYITAKNAGAGIRSLDAIQLAAIYRCTDTRGYQPKLPQTGSGTRSFFLGQIGVTDSQIGACVDQTVQEHDPASVNGNPLAIAPFSTARYSVNPVGSAPSTVVDIAATAPTAGVFFASRNIYNVVRKANYNADAGLRSIFGAGGYFCTRFNSGLNRQGFGVNANCGTPEADR
jgi:ABC-type phosphate transport system substrate-binding protein